MQGLERLIFEAHQTRQMALECWKEEANKIRVRTWSNRAKWIPGDDPENHHHTTFTYHTTRIEI